MVRVISFFGLMASIYVFLLLLPSGLEVLEKTLRYSPAHYTRWESVEVLLGVVFVNGIHLVIYFGFSLFGGMHGVGLVKYFLITAIAVLFFCLSVVFHAFPVASIGFGILSVGSVVGTIWFRILTTGKSRKR